MDFDFELIAAPFRMQPGLRRLAPGAQHLTPLAAGSALFEEKRRVHEAGASRHVVAGFDPAPALAAIAQQAALEGHPGFDADRLELAFEEDFAVLDGAAGTLPWLCVCVPSHWAPEDKLGLDFAAVHAPGGRQRRPAAAGSQLVRSGHLAASAGSASSGPSARRRASTSTRAGSRARPGPPATTTRPSPAAAGCGPSGRPSFPLARAPGRRCSPSA